MGISFNAAVILAIIVESILYGISTFLFGITLWTLTYRRKSADVSRLMLAAACLLLLLSTLHMVASANYVWQGFISSGNAEKFFEDPSNNTFKDVVNELETLFGDAILIYRCYVVWQRIEVIIIPIIGWITYLIAATYTIWMLNHMSPLSPMSEVIIYQQEMRKWVISAYTMALVTNLIATSILAFKLWLVHRSSSRICTTKSRAYPILIVIMGCGALYSMSLVTMLATYLAASNISYIVIDMIGQIVPITFCLVIVQTAMLRFDDRTTTSGRLQIARPMVQIDRTLVDSGVGITSKDSSGNDICSAHLPLQGARPPIGRRESIISFRSS